MALPATIDRVEDLPELVREHYVQRDGKWTLTLLSAEDHTGLRTALDSERRLRRDAETGLSSFKTKYEGIEPDEVVTLRQTVASFKDKQVYDASGLEELVARRTHEHTLAHARQMAAKDRELNAEKAQREAAQLLWKRDRIEAGLMEGALAAGISGSGRLLDAKSRGVSIFTDVDNDGKVIARDGEEIKYGKDGVTPYSPKEFYLNLKNDPEAQHLWVPSSGGGASQHHANGAGGIDYSKIADPTERLTAFRQAQGARH